MVTELKIYEVPEVLEKVDIYNNIAELKKLGEYSDIGSVCNKIYLGDLPIFKKVRDQPKTFKGIFIYSMYYVLLEDIEKYAKKKNPSFCFTTIYSISKLFDIYTDVVKIKGVGTAIYFKRMYDLDELEKRIEYGIYENISYNSTIRIILDILKMDEIPTFIIKNIIDIAITLESSCVNRITHKISTYERLKEEKEKKQRKGFFKFF